MADLKTAGAGKSKTPTVESIAGSKPQVTALESALEKWEKYFTPEEQAALRAYESEQGAVE